MHRRTIDLAVLALLLACTASARAVDVPTFAKVMLMKDARVLKVIIKPAPPSTPAAYPIPTAGMIGDDPQLSDVSDLNAFVYNGVGGSLTDPLTAGTWSHLGDPFAPTGYKYKNTGAPAGGAVKVIVLKPNVIKIIAKNDDTLLPGPIGSADVGVSLVVGTRNYCAGSENGIESQNQATTWKYKDNAAPAVCPTPSALDCCAGAGFHVFFNTAPGGDCGDLTTASGASSNLSCNGLYVGGGGQSYPLPFTVGDGTAVLTQITSCAADIATLGPTTSTQTGSNTYCSSAGCLLGAPLPIPSPSVPPLSLCAIPSFAGPASGTLNCGTGEQTVGMPVDLSLYLTGDTATDPASTIPGVQPCPLCLGGTCVGGPNNGMSCTPQTTALSSAFPTTSDCPPDPMLSIGTIPITASLTSGTVTWTATTATNDTGTEVNQPRVFSGFCRDADSSGAFEVPPHQCWENGMAVGSACSGTFETCEQRNLGAFGPGGGANMTISVVGTPQAGIESGLVPGTLVGIFSIPPLDQPTIDGAADWPGPGAVSLRGGGLLCPVANPCP